MNYLKKIGIFALGYYGTILIKLTADGYLIRKKRYSSNDIVYQYSLPIFGILGGSITYYTVYGIPKLLKN